jgi:hypothetical protein
MSSRACTRGANRSTGGLRSCCARGPSAGRDPDARATGRASVLADPDARGTEESDGSGASGYTGWAGQQLPSLYRLIGGVCSMAGVVLWTSTPRRSGPGQFGDCLAQWWAHGGGSGRLLVPENLSRSWLVKKMKGTRIPGSIYVYGERLELPRAGRTGLPSALPCCCSPLMIGSDLCTQHFRFFETPLFRSWNVVVLLEKYNKKSC